MKKYLIPILAALCASLTLFAQEANREITAKLAESYAELQSTYTPDFKVDGTNAKVNNVILLIGDGMGHGAVNAAMYANGGALTMTNLRTFGLVRTQSADNFTTDSAASGTAYATGQKTNNGFVGMNTERESSPPTTSTAPRRPFSTPIRPPAARRRPSGPTFPPAC